MWTYRHSTGDITHDGAVAGRGYSGHGPGVDNPALEVEPDVGPIPAGRWTIGPAFIHPRLGPLAMRLTPVGFDAHGRAGFFIQGDNARHDESGSEGCIVAPRAIRQVIADSQDTQLTVIP
jgi:hypothetical protein